MTGFGKVYFGKVILIVLWVLLAKSLTPLKPHVCRRYVIEGSLQDWAFHFGETLDMTMEISAVKRPAASTLPGFYDNNYNAIANFMLWPLSTLPSNTTSV